MNKKPIDAFMGPWCALSECTSDKTFKNLKFKYMEATIHQALKTSLYVWPKTKKSQ